LGGRSAAAGADNPVLCGGKSPSSLHSRQARWR
jgi:hypothetical protein